MQRLTAPGIEARVTEWRTVLTLTPRRRQLCASAGRDMVAPAMERLDTAQIKRAEHGKDQCHGASNKEDFLTALNKHGFPPVVVRITLWCVSLC